MPPKFSLENIITMMTESDHYGYRIFKFIFREKRNTISKYTQTSKYFVRNLHAKVKKCESRSYISLPHRYR